MTDSERITDLAYDPTDPQFLADPSDYYRWLRDEAPAHRHEASGTILISRFQDVWDATLDPKTYSSASVVGKLKHMASMDPPGHDRLRARTAAFFAPRNIAAFEPTVRELCRELLLPLREARVVDLVEHFTSIFPSRVIHRLLGVPDELSEALRTSALAIGSARDAGTMAELMNELEVLARRVVDGDPPPREPGLLQSLARENERMAPDEALSVEELRGVCSNIVLAGTDTVANLIGNGLVLLERHPEAKEELCRDPSRIGAAVEEMLRFEPPVQSLARRTTRDVTLHGVEVPADSELRLMWGAANLDEREFQSAEIFDIARGARRHLAFGQGIHFCLGAGLARLETRVAFEEILSLWPRLRVDESKLTRLPSLWVRAWERVPVELW
jgi:cytochrome P450